MKWTISCFFVLLLGYACGSRQQASTAEPQAPVLKPNTGLGISENRELLGTLIDLKTYPPYSVVFQWNGQDMDGLEAILYYDEQHYGDILNAYMEAGFPKGNYSKAQFSFPWLDSARYAELQFSKPDYAGNPDIFLGTGGRGMLWFLDKKVLLKVKP
ncbi:hypothetical protein [Niabella drilacis]|uniref:Uncharacterized protein n=1 Tax=Niabella drilacis (strain DSM 25811 / CCM 8410 / CCUG 62505 / LMG 26954 / E90) TaxID=1285928 RepID=A0A1G6TI77_NIADE|nr:hypothetical protein [Niabella drilacis]SDD28035.1 hypothetical protein SAMN04487894_107204 [Niabella drilacis]